ncbi:MAG: hypothetical protein CMF31_10785 [Kordiimonas sp.]|nr:hypothetical protein [Kordiimonas sp.]
MSTSNLLQMLIALLVVLALIGLLALLARRLGFTAQTTIGKAGSDKRRLHIVEVLPVDAKRRLVLLRCDQKEHLIMLGAERDLLIQEDINTPPAHHSDQMKDPQ